jgi:hypothetical protein
VGSGRTEVVRAVLEADPFLSSPGVPWHGALRELVCGVRGRLLALNASTVPGAVARGTPQEAVAMAALIRLTGSRLGELVHNSRATAKFRSMFDPAFSPSQFVEPELAPRLLERPLGFLASAGYPCWGGLTQAEIVRLMGGHSTPGDAPADPDQQEWLHALNDILVDVRERGSDLVTLHL